MSISIEELRRLAVLCDDCIAMMDAGLIVKMTEAEKLKVQQTFPKAEMILGNFIISKVPHRAYDPFLKE